MRAAAPAGRGTPARKIRDRCLRGFGLEIEHLDIHAVERMEESAVEPAQGGGIGADAEGKRQHHHGGEAGGLGELAEGRSGGPEAFSILDFGFSIGRPGRQFGLQLKLSTSTPIPPAAPPRDRSAWPDGRGRGRRRAWRARAIPAQSHGSRVVRADVVEEIVKRSAAQPRQGEGQADATHASEEKTPRPLHEYQPQDVTAARRRAPCRTPIPACVG